MLDRKTEEMYRVMELSGELMEIINDYYHTKEIDGIIEARVKSNCKLE